MSPIALLVILDDVYFHFNMAMSRVSREKIEATCYSMTLSLGYSSLKDDQMEVTTSFVARSEVFPILPTGYGKSLCYLCLPNVFDQLFNITNSVVVVITPLMSIMKDQVILSSVCNIFTPKIKGSNCGT